MMIGLFTKETAMRKAEHLHHSSKIADTACALVKAQIAVLSHDDVMFKPGLLSHLRAVLAELESN